jgi:hypothetical protein
LIICHSLGGNVPGPICLVGMHQNLSWMLFRDLFLGLFEPVSRQVQVHYLVLSQVFVILPCCFVSDGLCQVGYRIERDAERSALVDLQGLTVDQLEVVLRLRYYKMRYS